MDIGAWLRGLGLGQYEPLFAEHAIDAEALPELAEAHLEQLGIPLGHRLRLLKAAHALRQSATADDAPVRPAEASSVPRHAERRQLTVLFCDLVGSTSLSGRLDPEDMHEVIRGYQNAVAGVVERFEGHIAKFMGDGVLAYFGWPTPHEDAAERAACAGLALVEAVAALSAPTGDPLACRVGIATGLVVVGDLIGEGPAREEAVVGETPNLAARLQQEAGPGQVVVAESTRRLLGARFACEDLGRRGLKGIDRPVRTALILREHAAASRFDAHVGAQIAPLVGRDEELALLVREWQAARSGQGRAVLLVGEPGIGKSRLVRALGDAIAVELPRILLHQCSPFHTRTPLWPVLQQIALTAGFMGRDEAKDRCDRLAALLRESFDCFERPLALLAPLLGITLEPDPLAGLDPRERRVQTLEALVERFLGLARKAPMLVVVEDVHWIDPTSLEMVRRALTTIGQARVLLVLTTRAEGEPALAASLLRRLPLGRLPRAAADRLVADLVAAHALGEKLRHEILARTDGVPLFLEELTKALLEASPGELAASAVPATLQDSLLARLGRSPAMQAIAQIAACIGREFDHALLTAVADLPSDQLEAGLDELVRRELVARQGIPPEASYSFKHALIRDAAYQSLLRTRRRKLHARIAEALQPQVMGTQPELIAYHLAEAGMPDRAAAARLAAGRLGKARHAIREAMDQTEAALLLARDAERLMPGIVRPLMRECHVLQGNLASVADDLEAANAAYEAALALADTDAERVMIGNMRHRLAFATLPDGARLAYYEHGSGGPAVVFVGPIAYGLATFQPILERLCQDFRIITVDCRGVGRSDPLFRPYSIRRHAQDLGAVLEQARAGPVVGVGISRGSIQLLWLAHERPELIDKLVLVGMPLASAAAGARAHFNPAYIERRREAYERGDLEALIELQMAFVYTEPNAEAARQLAIERCRRLPRETAMSFFDPDPDMDVASLLDSIDVPTLVAHGREDRLISFAAAELLTARLKDARLYAFEGKGHLPTFTATEEFCAALRSFAGPGAAEAGSSRHGPLA